MLLTTLDIFLANPNLDPTDLVYCKHSVEMKTFSKPNFWAKGIINGRFTPQMQSPLLQIRISPRNVLNFIASVVTSIDSLSPLGQHTCPHTFRRLVGRVKKMTIIMHKIKHQIIALIKQQNSSRRKLKNLVIGYWVTKMYNSKLHTYTLILQYFV